MSMVSILVPGNAAEIREPDNQSPNPYSRIPGKAGNRSARFDAVMEHALRRPEHDATGRVPSNANERPPASNGSVRRKPGGHKSEPARVSDSTMDSDPDHDEPAQAQRSPGTSGTLENCGLTAVVVAALAQPPA